MEFSRFSFLIALLAVIISFAAGKPVPEVEEKSESRSLKNGPVSFQLSWPGKAKSTRKLTNAERGLFGKGSALFGGAAYYVDQSSSSLPAKGLSWTLNQAGYILGNADAYSGYLPLIGGALALFG